MTKPICLHCDEVITGPADWIPLVATEGVSLRPRHYVCALRAVVGGINHLMGRCTCCGGTEPPDPPDLTRYQAAIVAVAYYNAQTRSEP